MSFFPYAFVNLLNPVYAYVAALFGRNIFWADGSYTNIFGKTKAGKPAGAPEEAHAKALANLEARRAAFVHRLHAEDVPPADRG